MPRSSNGAPAPQAGHCRWAHIPNVLCALVPLISPFVRQPLRSGAKGRCQKRPCVASSRPGRRILKEHGSHALCRRFASPSQLPIYTWGAASQGRKELAQDTALPRRFLLPLRLFSAKNRRAGVLRAFQKSSLQLPGKEAHPRQERIMTRFTQSAACGQKSSARNQLLFDKHSGAVPCRWATTKEGKKAAALADEKVTPEDNAWGGMSQKSLLIRRGV